MRIHLSASRWGSLVLAGTLAIGAMAISSPASAKHHDDSPPGWSHGEKRGWNGHDEPPGLYRKHYERRHHRDDFDNDRDDRRSDDDYGYSNHNYSNDNYSNDNYSNDNYSNDNYWHNRNGYSGSQYSRPGDSVFTRNRNYSPQQPRITVRQRAYRGRTTRRVQPPRISIHRR